MSSNTSLHKAKKAKNDEFYTQYQDIEREINAYLKYDPDVFKDKTVLLPCDDPDWSNFTKYFAQNFEKLKLKKLISTSFAPDGKPEENSCHTTLSEMDSKEYDKNNHPRGKIYTLTDDVNNDNKIKIKDLKCVDLEGDGDFRSDEIKMKPILSLQIHRFLYLENFWLG